VVEEQRTTSLWAPAGSSAFGARRSGGQADRRPGTSSDYRSALTARPGDRPTGPEEEASQDAPRYIKGERVRHRRFGSGTIQGLAGTGRDMKVSVAFDDAEVGVKQLLVAYAGLERDIEGA
jgi:hypothetical protein